MTLKQEYKKLKAIRKWNASFRTPPVSSVCWNKHDWEQWEKSREPLPPFEEWAKLQPVSAG